jgi:hypothetical protein
MRLLFLSSATWFVLVTGIAAQLTEPRRVPFPGKRLAAVVRPGEPHVVIRHPSPPPLSVVDTSKPFVTQLVERAQVIIVTRVIGKKPAFLNLVARRIFTSVAAEEANWIGSEVEMRVERVIKNDSGENLEEGNRLSYIEDSHGTAVINGTRIETETDWLRPIEVGLRYLMTVRLAGGRFTAEGIWEEPAPRSSLRGTQQSPPPPQYRTPPAARPTPFDDWNVDQAVYWLELEKSKLRPVRP